MKKLKFLVAAFLATITCAGQEYSLKQFTLQEGLPQSRISCISRDSLGYLWLGTPNSGVASFDGRNFISYSTLEGLQSNSVLSIVAGEGRHLWIIHPRGVTKFDGFTFLPLRNPNSELNKTAFLYKEKLYIWTASGFLYADNDSLVKANSPFDRRVVSVKKSQDGREWIFFDDKITKVLKNGIEEFTLKVDFNPTEVRSIFAVDASYYFSFHTGNVIPAQPAQKTVPINSIDFNQQRKRFLEYEGLNLYSIPEGDWQHKMLLMEDVILNQFLITESGEIWLATEGAGLVALRKNKFVYQKFRGVSALIRDGRGNLIYGSYLDGVWKGEDKQLKRYADINVTGALRQADKIWIASRQGLGPLEGNEVVIKLNEFIFALDKQNDSGIWCGTRNGLVLFKDTVEKRIDQAEGKLIGSVKFVKHWPHQQRVVFGNESSIYSLDLKTNDITKLTFPSLRGSLVTSMAILRDSILLMATHGGGLLVLDERFKVLSALNSKSGIKTNFVSAVGVDSLQSVWLGTNSGIYKIKFSNDLTIQGIHHLPINENYYASEVLPNAIDLNGAPAFGMVDGAITIHEEPERKCDQKLHFVKFYNQHHDLSNLLNEKVIEIPFKGNDIEIGFNKVFCSESADRRIFYKLKPFQSEWIDGREDRIVNFQNLEPGTYEFMIRNLNTDGQWSSTERVNFIIQPEYYQTTLFRVGIVLLTLIITYWTIRWRGRVRALRLVKIQQEQEMENERIRKEIARDFHDETGNQLSLIVSYSSLLKEQHDPNGFASVIESAAQKLYYSTKDFIWSVDPVNDEVSKLFIHIKDLGEKLFETDSSISFRAENEISERKRLPFGTSRQVSLIFTEAINNAFKYAKAKNILFKLSNQNGTIEFLLKDDGVGFDFNALAKSGGLANMKHRAIKLKGKLSIDSIPGNGTIIKLQI